ncbi:MAG: YeeE/YedE family protein [Deltaproteobacteria bacterium]|nr:YeeE/YedE family protein [Deltaproteobacteria bacterium]
MRTIVFFAGVLFAVGLGLSGMTNPDIVQGFFDFFGEWNPQLGLVMAGAVAVTGVAFPFILKRRYSLQSEPFHVPARRKVDLKLVIGSALFGLGWGAIGICPGPAVVSLVTGSTLLFVVAMFMGIWLHARFVEQK